jgi:hypothetical protein
MRWWWWWGCAFANARRERGLGTKSHKTERDGSILGAPCEMAVEGDGVRCWGGVDEMVVGVWPRVRKREVGEEAGGQKPRNRARWLDFGCAVRNGSKGRWGEVVEWRG